MSNYTKLTGTPLSNRQAQAFRSHREKAKLTQTQVAQRLGLRSHRCIVAWEKGQWLPRLETSLRLAEIYGCSVDDLINPKN